MASLRLHSSSLRRAPRLAALAGLTLLAALQTSAPAAAQEGQFWQQNEGQASGRPSRPRRDDAYRAPDPGGPPGGFGQQADVGGQPYDGAGYGGQPGYGAAPPAGGAARPYGSAQGYGQPSQGTSGYGSQGYGNQGYGPQGSPPQGYGNQGYGSQSYGGGNTGYSGPTGGGPYGTPQAQGGYGAGGYGAAPHRSGARPDDAYRPPAQPQYGEPGPQYSSPYPSPPPGGGGYGQPYSPPPDPNAGDQYAGPADGPGYRQDYGDERRGWDDRRGGGTYSQNEVVDAGHRFFGSVSQGLARAVESVFKRQGRPNGYILGEDAGGAFVAGLRYGEGMLTTKDAGNHKVYWQGPSLGYDFGGEGSKAMVLVYNLRDPSDIYRRFGGVQGSAYLIGGVSVQFQQQGHVTLAVIRSGVGLRLGANVGYLKYSRSPTWNPF